MFARDRVSDRVPVRGGLLASVSLFLAVGCGSPDTDVPVRASVAAADVGAGPAAPMTRPPGMPNDYVPTPNGYFHRSCVVELAADETIGADHKIHRPDGRTRDVAACDHPRYDRAGQAVASNDVTPTVRRSALTAVAPDASQTPSTNSWVQSASSADHGPLNWLAANFTVPSNPAMESSQLLYYFPGLQPIVTGTDYTIMQPVLKYHGGRWTIASWNCCVDGMTVHSPEVPVNPGDTLYGYVQGHNCDGTGFCNDWQVYTGDWTTGGSTTLNTTSYGSVMGWAFGGALEVYYLDDCAQYPTSGSISFTNLQVRTTQYLSVYPTWHSGGPFQGTPACPYSVSSPDTSRVDIFTGSTTVPSPGAPARCGIIEKGQGLRLGQSISSCDGRFTLTLQASGNLVLTQGSATLWSSNTTGGHAVEMMSGGEFVLWSASSKRIWSTGTSWHDAHLAIQNDGNVVVYTSGGSPLWSTNTCCR